MDIEAEAYSSDEDESSQDEDSQMLEEDAMFVNDDSPATARSQAERG